MRSFSHFVISPTVFIFIVFCVFVTPKTVLHAQLSTCNTYHAYHKTPSGFGAVYDVFASNKEILMNATDCTSTGFNALIGHAGKTPTNFAVYEKGYVWNGSKWVQISYAPNGGSKKGVYLMGNAKFASRSKYYGINTFFVAFTCSKVSGAWKCGCKDSTCAQKYWQLQGATKGYDIAQGGGGGSTTGGGGVSGGGGTGAGSVEIGLSNVTGDALGVFGTNIRWTAWFHGHFLDALNGQDNTPGAKRRIYAVGVVPQGSSWAAAANGSLEGYWRDLLGTYSRGMDTLGLKELLLGVWHEGNNQPGECWGVGQRGCPEWTSTEDFKEGVKRFVQLGRSIDPRLKYYWNPGCWGNSGFMDYVPYPGTIDYVGCDLYDNQNSLGDQHEHFNNFIKPQLDPLVAYAKQNDIGLVFPEFGLTKNTSSDCGEHGRAQSRGGGDNVVFVDSFFNYLKGHNIRAIVVYHNSDWDISSQIGGPGYDCWGDSYEGRFPRAQARLNEIFRTPGGARWGE